MSLFKRLFIGLELPASSKALMEELDPGLSGLRWLPAAQLHLTLSFLGDVAQEQQTALHDSLRHVRVPSFFLPLQGVGFFRARGRPSVVWIGVGKGHPHLFALHKHVQDALLHAGLEPDLKPFHPHVTVARSCGISTQGLQPWIRRHESDDFGIFEVKDFILYSSILAPRGSEYHEELRLPLTS
jgi:RNA 2',3'-cyclic 3'-phosphodiesterase